MAATLSLSRISWDLTTISAQVAARSGISAQRPGIHAMVRIPAIVTGDSGRS
jgi:hypothetical protein